MQRQQSVQLWMITSINKSHLFIEIYYLSSKEHSLSLSDWLINQNLATLDRSSAMATVHHAA